MASRGAKVASLAEPSRGSRRRRPRRGGPEPGPCARRALRLGLALVLLLGAGCGKTPAPRVPEPGVAEALRAPSRAEVCARRDGGREADRWLCEAMAAAESGPPARSVSRWREAARRARALVEEGAPALRDPALRLFLRERIAALLVWYSFDETGTPQFEEPAEYARAAAERLERYYPHAFDPDDRGSFHLARTRLEPEASCPREEEVTLLLFPGVIRTGDEFATPRRELPELLPCLRPVLVETGTLLTPERNAPAGCSALRHARAEGAAASVHLLGYSQGARNLAQTLVTCPEASTSVRTVLSLNGAAHGSPIADSVALSTVEPGLVDAWCAGYRGLRLRWCRWTVDSLADASELGRALAIPLGSTAFRERAGLGPDVDLESFLESRLAGLRSLGSYAARNFWSGPGAELPRDVLWLSFRSILTDVEGNLPESNRLFYRAVFRAGGRSPWNDMQVRLVDQRWGGRLAPVEVVEPVAEGNHWQWVLEPHEVPEIAIPDRMLERYPGAALLLAHYAALAEVGLLH